MKTFLKWKGSNFLRKCKKYEKCYRLFLCQGNFVFWHCKKNSPRFWEHKTNCFRMQNRVRFSSFIFLLLAFMVLHEIFNFASRITCFFLWKQAPFRWCVLKIQKNLTRKMGFLHFCCWITKCNFEKEKKKHRVFQWKNKNCHITVPLKPLS